MADDTVYIDSIGQNIQDLTRAKKAAGQLVEKDTFGKMGESQAIQDIIRQRRQLSQGLTAPEMADLRSQGRAQISGATQAQSRALRAAQARAGVKGATAGRQQMDVLSQGAQAQQQLETDLIMRDRAAREQGLAGLENIVTGTTQFDIGQAANQKLLGLQTATGLASLASADRAALLQQEGVNLYRNTGFNQNQQAQDARTANTFQKWRDLQEEKRRKEEMAGGR